MPLYLAVFQIWTGQNEIAGFFGILEANLNNTVNGVVLQINAYAYVKLAFAVFVDPPDNTVVSIVDNGHRNTFEAGRQQVHLPRSQ